MYLPGLNFSGEPPPTRSTYQSTPPPLHSHNSFFLESPLLKIGTFFSFQQIPFEQTAFLRRTITCKNTLSQKPTTAHWIEKKNSPATPHKNIVVLCLQSPPFHLEQLSAVVFWCARMCLCVCVFKYLLRNHRAN